MDTGLRVLPWTATPLFVAPLAGALSDRVGRRPLMLAGMILQALGFLLFDAIGTSDAVYWQTILPLVASGIGVSMVLPVTPAAILSAVAPIDMGRASAVNNTLQRFGTAFGVAVATAIFIANGSLANPASFVDGFRPALLAVAVLSVLGAIAAVAVGRPQVTIQLPSAERASAVALSA
jgi:MFS family permease